jgi:hypothetical protein
MQKKWIRGESATIQCYRLTQLELTTDDSAGGHRPPNGNNAKLQWWAMPTLRALRQILQEAFPKPVCGRLKILMVATRNSPDQADGSAMACARGPSIGSS